MKLLGGDWPIAYDVDPPQGLSLYSMPYFYIHRTIIPYLRGKSAEMEDVLTLKAESIAEPGVLVSLGCLSTWRSDSLSAPSALSASEPKGRGGKGEGKQGWDGGRDGEEGGREGALSRQRGRREALPGPHGTR